MCDISLSVLWKGKNVMEAVYTEFPTKNYEMKTTISPGRKTTPLKGRFNK